MSKWTYLKYFQIFKMAAILRSGRSFNPEVVPKFGSCTKIGHAHPYILSFWSTFSLKNWRSCGNLKIWPIFRPDDVIDDAIHTKNYRALARFKIHICTKFGVDCLNGATNIVNITDRQTNTQTNRQTNILAKLKILASNERAIGDCVLAKIT